MKSQPQPEPELPFSEQPQTVATLANAREVLDSIGETFYEVSREQNTHLDSTPYESAMLFSIDTRPSNRASALLHTPSFDKNPGERHDFALYSALGRRFIYNQTALGDALQYDHASPTFRTSRANPEKQLMWTYPLIDETRTDPDTAVAAIQFGYTINKDPDWNYPGNDDLEKACRKHHDNLITLSRELGSLARRTSSLSKSLEIAPPTEYSDIIISWDFRNSTPIALSWEYPIFEAYLEQWKARRAQITAKYNATKLDRGEGEHIIIPFSKSVNVYDSGSVKRFGKNIIPNLLDELLTAHEEIARSFRPRLFPNIHFGVAVGNLEEDQDGNPTGQALWDVKQTMRENNTRKVSYTRAAISAFDLEPDTT